MVDEPDDESSARSSFGFVYILTNPRMPGLVKIGQTERHPIVRALELSSRTGVPAPFQVAYFCEVNDRFAAERSAKAALVEQQVSADREFFEIPPLTARDIIETVAVNYIVRGSWRQLGYEDGEELCRRCHRPARICTC